MSIFNINNIDGSGHTLGDKNRVKNNFTSVDKVLTRDDYYQILLEIWDLGRVSVWDYLDDKYEQCLPKNPHFVELLYRDVYKVMDGVGRPGDGDIFLDDGDLQIENGDIKTDGHTNNFYDAMTWLHFKVVAKKLDNDYEVDLNDPFGKFIVYMENFEKNVLEGGHDSPNVTKRLNELNQQLKAERDSRDMPRSGKTNNLMHQQNAIPKAFISYAWDDYTKAWVKQLATRLRGDGVDVTIDQWSALPGDQLPLFMENAVRGNDYVLIICNPRYKEKSNNRQGGVGYEGDIMTGEVFQNGNHKKYIPIILEGTKDTSLPSWLAAKYYIDLSHASTFENGYMDLITTLHNAREMAPPLGKRPTFSPMEVRNISEPIEEEIKINGILVDEVTIPRNDGTSGSALYAIPFELNNQPSSDWVDIFISCWDHPPRFTSMHRPGIASVVGKKIILDGTDIEEVERYHRDTLKLCVSEANKKYNEVIEKRELINLQRKQSEEEHKRNIENITKRISF